MKVTRSLTLKVYKAHIILMKQSHEKTSNKVSV